MTNEERKALAESLIANPLMENILAEIEKSATEALIYASNEQDRIKGQADVLAARAFRSALTRAVNTHKRKGAPA